MSLIFDYDKRTKKINRILRKYCGVGCNCFFCYDTVADSYRLCFVETIDDKKHTPTQLINDSLNHLFFNNLNGTSVKESASDKDIESYCVMSLNFFQDRKNFLLRLCNIFATSFHMTETAAVSSANEWQQCIMMVVESKKNHVTLYLDPVVIDRLHHDHKLYKMTKGLDVNESPKGVKYKTLELDLESLENTILLYS